MPKFTRVLILRCCSLGILIVLGMKLLVESSAYQFPKNSALDKLELSKTFKSNYYGAIIQGRGYKSKESENNLTVEVYYIPNNIGGNKQLIKEYQKSKSLPENITILENTKIGYYGLFTENNEIHLNTCIHPEGKTAFTRPQFANIANKNLKSRLLPWILGFSELRDWRCFWVNMSLSLDNISQEEASDILQRQLLNLVAKIPE